MLSVIIMTNKNLLSKVFTAAQTKQTGVRQGKQLRKQFNSQEVSIQEYRNDLQLDTAGSCVEYEYN